MIKPEHKKKILDVFSDVVKFAFIFGSANTEYYNKNSDIDIAVWLTKPTSSINEIIDLKYSAEKSINFEKDIDILILNNADIIVTNQVITTGKIILDNDPEFTNNFITSRKSMYFDFKFFRKNLENNLITKVL